MDVPRLVGGEEFDRIFEPGSNSLQFGQFWVDWWCLSRGWGFSWSDHSIEALKETQRISDFDWYGHESKSTNQPQFGKGTSICQPFSWWSRLRSREFVSWCRPSWLPVRCKSSSYLSTPALICYPKQANGDWRNGEKNPELSAKVCDHVLSNGLRLQSWDFRFRNFEAS